MLRTCKNVRRSMSIRNLNRRLWLNTLEDRLVPATFTVNLVGDAGTADLIDPNKGDIRYVIGQANSTLGNDVVLFDPSITSISLNSQLDVSDAAALLIDGNGVVSIANIASASGLSRLFNITTTTTSEIEFRGLTLKNGVLSAGGGGAIQAANSNLKLTNCTFDNNRATAVAGGAGGALSTTGASVIVNISGCTFTNNTAGTTGGALSIGGTGTANITINGSTFVNNSNSGTTGGAIHIGMASTLSVGATTGCTFTGNNATTHGGAIHTAGSVTATFNNSTFAGNRAVGTTGNGGAISFGTSVSANISNSVISNNTSGSVAGGIRCAASTSTVTLNSSTVSGNFAGSSTGGGLSMFGGQLKAYYSTFANNICGGSGGALYSTAATMTIINCTISGNEARSASGGGGGINLTSGVLNLNNSTVVNNRATGATAIGGGIRKTLVGGSITLNSSVVAANACTSGTGADLGGSVAITVGGNNNFTGAGTTSNINFTNAPSTGDPRFAPLENYGGPTLTHGFRYNSPLIDQGNTVGLGGITNDQRGSGFGRTIDDGSVANGSGGATDIGAVEGKLTTPFVDSVSGLVAITSPTMMPYTFSAVYDDETGVNNSSLNMGEIRVSSPGGFLTFTPSVTSTLAGPGPNQTTVSYEFNPPAGGWQAIHGGTYTIELLANKVLDNDIPAPQANRAQTIGAFVVGIAGPIVVDSSADIDDGNVSPGNVTLREAIRISNSSVGGTDTISFAAGLIGSTIGLTNGQLDVSDGVDIVGPGSANLTIYGAPAAAFTNRIFSIIVPTVVATVNISGLTMANANTTGAGGAVVVADETVNFTDVNFNNNKAAGIGGAVAGTSLTLTFNNCVFSGNSATGNGGAIAMNAGTNVLNITNSTFANNTSLAQGGAVQGGSTITLNITGSTFSHNTAATGGGALNIGLSTGTVDIGTSTFSNNSSGNASTSVGGAINLPSGGTFLIHNSSFINNKAGASGGAINAGSANPTNVTINNTTFTGNSATTTGGAINASTTGAGSQFDIKTSTVSGNTATTNGGGIYVSVATLTITESTLSNNSAVGNAGGLGTATTAQVTFTNSTISGNTAGGTSGGGGVRIGGAGALTLNLTTLTNNSATNAAAKGGGVFINNNAAIFQVDGSIIAGNFNLSNRDISSASGVNLSGSHNLLGAVDPSVVFVLDGINTQSGTELTPLSPGLFPLANNGGPTQTHGLWYNGNALNKGSNVLSIDHDQRGQPRDTLNPNLTDVGAFEGTLALPFVSSVGPIADIVVAGTTPIAVTIVYDDETNIDTATLGADDIAVTGVGTIGPISFLGFAQSGKQVTATYSFAAPGGMWEAFENGVYSISINSGKVFDLDGTPNSVLPGVVGTFRVNLPGPMSIVVDNIVDENDGDYSAGDISLREAVLLTNTTVGGVDTITFSPTLNGQTITLSKGEMAISDSLMINGPGSALLTIDANKASRIFNISDGTATVLDVTISGLKLTKGNAAGGGAIVMAPESVTLNDIFATANASSSLGGVVFFNTSGVNTLTINNSTFTNNTATGNGGTVGTSGGANVITVLNSTFSGNMSSANGGVFDTGGGGGALNVTNSSFTGNTATSAGGVVSAGYAKFDFKNCTLSGNTAGGTGGAANGYNNTQFFTNCTIVNNVAGTGGGAITINKTGSTSAKVFLISSTVVGNRTTSGNGGGVRLNSTSTAAGVVLSVINSIVAENGIGASLPGTPSDLFRGAAAPNNIADVNFSAIGASAGFTLSGTSSDNLAFGTALNLGPLQNNGGPTMTMVPLPGSPLIDGGDNTANMLATDQRGLTRTVNDPGTPNAGDGTDIGAVEVNAAVPPTVGAILVNGNADAQRSRVTSIKVSFSEMVSFPAGINNAFVVERTGKGSVGAVNISAVQIGSDVTITFATGGVVGVDPGNSLQDGQYKLTIVANNVQGTSGLTLDGDGDMIAEGSPTDDATLAFHRLFGDSNGDGAVTATDFNAFRLTYGAGPSIFDFDGDGNTSASDFNNFRLRYGLSGYTP